MKKNVSGQKTGAQMVSATDGSAITSGVTVYVTGDAGTQGLGSVGSGVCTHEGNGYHTYAPAQAETNYDLVAFTFIASGAVPASVQIYTSFPQTADIIAAIAALNNLSAANVNAEVVDALTTDTYAEPGQAAPPTPASIQLKVAYLYKALTNLIEQNATTFKLYNRAGTVVDQKAAVSNDGTTFSRGLIGTGP